MQYVEDVYDMGQDAYDTGISPEFLGGVGGIVAGATIGGILASQLSFSSTMGQAVASGGIFLVGAGLYGYGLSGRVSNPALRSATQVSGVIIGGLGLGRLLSTFGAPSFGLGAEDRMGIPAPDDGRVIGQDYGGRTLGQSAEDEDDVRSRTDYQENWNNVQNSEEEGGARVEESAPFTPTLTQPANPSWATGLSSQGNPFGVAEEWGIADASNPSVTQWFGSAESVTFSPQSAMIGNVTGADGLGSIIGQ